MIKQICWGKALSTNNQNKQQMNQHNQQIFWRKALSTNNQNKQKMNQNNQKNIKIHQKKAYGAGGRPWALAPGLGAGGLGAGDQGQPFFDVF